MFRHLVSISLLLALPAVPLWGQETAEAAKSAFDVARQDWAAVVGQLKEKHQQQAQAGDGDGSLAAEIAALDQQSQALVQKIVAAGLQVYQAEPDKYPDVNETLVAIAGFYVIGDRHGDGGDQYEKALPIIKALLAAGAGKQWEELWVRGGACAYCLNQFDLAEEYFNQASSQGLFQDLPQRPARDPNLRVRQTAAGWSNDLQAIRLRWRKEQGIRAAEAEADDLPRVKLTTSKGEIVIELFENEAPESVANFLTLVKQGYYNGVTFHRVLPMFMAQGGDPQGTGSGGPGYTIRDEHTLPIHRKHFRGSLSMAKTGAPNSGGSQFFLTFVPTGYLDGRHTVFGRVIEGMENAALLKRRDPQSPSPPKPDKIISAEVLRDRGHDYPFEKIPELGRP